MVGCETLWPRKHRTQAKPKRWLTNIGFVVIGSVLIRLTFPIVAIGVAAYGAMAGYGLLNGLPLPRWIAFIVAFLALDLSIYAQHVATHKVPVLWRFHQVHHADRDIDATTGVRFHPIEIALSMMYKMLVVFILGPSVLVVLVFEIVLNAAAIFNHANVKIPLRLDRSLRIFIVTPDMHRVHHSVLPQETDRNYGFNFSVWDRIFRTYQSQPQAGHDAMTIGLPDYQTDAPSDMVWSLTLPFKKVDSHAE